MTRDASTRHRVTHRDAFSGFTPSTSETKKRVTTPKTVTRDAFSPVYRRHARARNDDMQNIRHNTSSAGRP